MQKKISFTAKVWIAGTGSRVITIPHEIIKKFNIRSKKLYNFFIEIGE